MWVIAVAVVVLAACVQASVGFAYALLAAPLLQLVSPELVPGPVLVSSLVLSTLTALRERSDIDRKGVALALAGRVPGALLAGAAIAWLPGTTYDLIFGALLLAAIAISLGGIRVRPTPPALLITGSVSGFMGTLTSVGGPPIALLYQHASGPVVRATLNAYFVLGSLISIAVLTWAGAFGLRHLVLGLALSPAVWLGFYASRFVHGRIDGHRLRPLVLGLAAVSSLAVMARALLS